MIEVSVRSVTSYISIWHPTKNVGIDPSDPSHKITDNVWWRCKKGHEWKASIASIIWGNDCPKCRTRPSSLENNLSTTHPEIAKEWHPTKNIDLEICNFTYGSNEIVWWLCANGHEWKDSIKKRCRDGGVMCQACKRSKRKKKSITQTRGK
jgi:hypothetical protein